METYIIVIINRETFHQEWGETRYSASSLEIRALISQLADSVKDQVKNFLANSVVTFCIVVGSIFIASDKLFRVEKLAVCTSSNFIDLKLKSSVHYAPETFKCEVKALICWNLIILNITQILREINFGEFKWSKYAIVAILEVLNPDFW